MTRGAHRIDASGFCKRCALPRRANGGQCPPGFWMSKRELAAWEGFGTEARSHLERTLGKLCLRPAQEVESK